MRPFVPAAGVAPAPAMGNAGDTEGLAAAAGTASAGGWGRAGAFTRMIWGRRDRVALGMGRTREGAC